MWDSSDRTSWYRIPRRKRVLQPSSTILIVKFFAPIALTLSTSTYGARTRRIAIHHSRRALWRGSRAAGRT